MTDCHTKNNMVQANYQQNRYNIDNLLEQPSQAIKNQQIPVSMTHSNQQSDMNFVNKENRRQQRIPPPISTNLIPIMSPAGSKRGSPSSDPDEDDYQIVNHHKKKKQKDLFNNQKHQHQQNNSVNKVIPTTNAVRPVASRIITNSNNNVQHRSQLQQNITTESARYAISRFPYPPFITRFNSNKVTLNLFKEEVVNHFTNNHQINIEILNCRSSTIKCDNNNDIDILLYVKDSSSFTSLFDKSKWPLRIGGENYTFPSWPSIPPQLSLIVKNVNVQMDFEEFTDEVKSMFPEIINVIRMKNQLGNSIHLVKLELTSCAVRQEILNAKKLVVNYIYYEIVEFLAPANVLICSRCCGIGHFRKQCPEKDETCKNCAEAFPDLKLHRCATEPKCKHCLGTHLSNSMKCPVIKTFRADLTKKLLNSNNHQTSSSAVRINSINQDYNHGNFPILPSSQTTLNNSVLSKLDMLLSKMTNVNEQLANITSKQETFEQFMKEKTQHDERVNQQIDTLLKNDLELKKDLVRQNLLIERHENLFIKLLLPMFEDLFTLIAAQNLDKKGNALDADLKCRLERYLVQVKKTREGKQCLN